jgi:hypothetical protein
MTTKAFEEIWTEEWEKMRTPVALLTRQSPTGSHPEDMHAAVSAPAALPLSGSVRSGSHGSPRKRYCPTHTLIRFSWRRYISVSGQPGVC